MVVQLGDLEVRYSTTAGSAGDSETGNAAGSLGKYMSTTEIPDAVRGNLIPNITAEQNAMGVTLYRCRFVVNTNASDTWNDVKVWIQSKTSSGATAAIGLDPTGVVDADDTDPQAVEIANGTTAPEGVTFSAPTDAGSGLEVGTVGPGQCFALWIRATVPADSPALSDDALAIRCEGTTV